ncbi:MAG: M20/M25/M40 family metallo-hydrolase [Saprospiraceae bacterium]|nr:M20/M25/M40 family metallo-hydrolase [Saprospiraceae bacterium]
MKNFILCIVLLGFGQSTLAQSIDTKHITYPIAKKSLHQLKELLAIPNDANFPEDIERNLSWVDSVFHDMGFRTQRLETETVPLLLANYNSNNPTKKTVLFYFHIDGQPVDPQFWFQDNPYEATLKKEVEGEGWIDMDWSNVNSEVIDSDWRIFARSSSDDKSPFVMFLTALKEQRDRGVFPDYNLKVILDFEEEKGSPRLAGAVEKYKSALESDMLLIFDGPKHISNQPTITYGARGITTVTIKVYGPTFPLHSGHYGNYAPNPALRLAQLLTTMKDDDGRVTISGFYDGIEFDEKTKAILANVPDNENEFRVKLGIGNTDKVGSNYQESIQYPSLNIRGMGSGWIGSEARTIVPATATAEIDIRLVVESPPQRQIGLVKNHILDQGYLVLDRKPTSKERFDNPKICQFINNRAYEAFRTEIDSPLGVWAYETIKEEFGGEPIRVRTLGGSVPISPFIQSLNVPAVIIPLVNSDNNQHSPNENLRIGNYFDGVKTFYAFLNSTIQ